MTIRPAKPDDAPRIAELLAQLGYPPGDDSFTESKISSYTCEPYHLLVCDIGHQTVGFISLHWFDMFHHPKKMGRITALCVDETIRAHGIGGFLLIAAEKFLQEKDCDQVEVTTNLKRTLTPSFYTKHGYHEDSRRFIKKLT